MKNSFIFLLTIFSAFLLTTDTFTQPAVHKISPAKSNLTVLDLLSVKSHYISGSEFFQAANDTIRIIALRAAFQADAIATTTGDGSFDLTTDSEYIFDRPPHDRAYFQHQLLALANYFKTISKSRLILSGDVFPADENTSYQLPHDIAYYSGREDDKQQSIGWSELLRDAVQLAEQQDDPDFSKYDAVIVFHAGVGQDFAFDFDTTPYDIQSVFIDFATLQEGLAAGQDFNGIPAGENTFIREGIILPETQNQEGQNLALLGTMTLLVGSQLGMPNLFDTESGNPGIGRWGLMDQGSYNFQGLIPAEPDAWTKIYMDWEEPVVINNIQDANVAVSGSGASPHIYKIPINENEYFLVENRQRDWNGDGITIGRDEIGKRVEFDTLGSIVAEEGIGVITQIEEYDFGLPGSGILIWHIDENVIRANLESNTINNSITDRGIDLVESDGAQDIGYSYDFFSPGSGTENGDYFDPYWAGNISHQVVNDTNIVELSPASIPNSDAKNNAKSHIKIYNFSRRDAVMTFSAASTLNFPGFPQYAGNAGGPGAIVTTEINGQTAIFAATIDGKILAWNPDGSKFIANDYMVEFQDVTGKTVTAPLAVFAETADSLFRPLLSLKANPGEAARVLAVDKSSTLYVWETTDREGDGRADLIASVSLGGAEPTAGPMRIEAPEIIIIGLKNGNVILLDQQNFQIVKNVNIAAGAITGLAAFSDMNFVATSSDGGVFVLNSEGTTIRSFNALNLAGKNFFPLALNLTNYDGPSIFVISDEGEMASLYLNEAPPQKVQLPNAIKNPSAPALADIDNDNFPEIIISYSNGLGCFELTGVPCLNFPQTYLNAPESAVPWQNSPISLNANGANVVLAGTTDGVIKSFTAKAKSIEGFPLSTSSAITTTPYLDDLDRDGDVELVAIAADRYLYIWDLPYDASPGWSVFGGDINRTFSYTGQVEGQANQQELITPRKVFCYPNPNEEDYTNIRYSLNKTVDRIKISIYDLAGDFVEEIAGNAATSGDHEVRWELSEIESGVYLARVEAMSAGQNQVEFIKIAVIK